MYASTHPHEVPISRFCRYAARWTAAVLVAMWLASAVLETFKPEFRVTGEMWFQGAALAAVFAGYAIGWSRELAGGVVVLVATLAYVLACRATSFTMPGAETLLFAVPGVLLLEAWRLEHRPHEVKV